jgi:hypothetical protein
VVRALRAAASWESTCVATWRDPCQCTPHSCSLRPSRALSQEATARSPDMSQTLVKGHMLLHPAQVPADTGSWKLRPESTWTEVPRVWLHRHWTSRNVWRSLHTKEDGLCAGCHLFSPTPAPSTACAAKDHLSPAQTDPSVLGAVSEPHYHNVQETFRKNLPGTT